MNNKKRIVFAGDSITDCGRLDGPNKGLGDGYVRHIALALTGDTSVVVNRGVSGNCAADLRKRWSADVLDEKPDVLTIFVGINETSRCFDRDAPTTNEEFEHHYRALLDTATAAPLDALILVEPFLLPVENEQTFWLDDLAGKRAVVRRLAAEFRASFLPLHSVLTDEAARTGASAITWDGIHPTPAGHSLIAEAWMRIYASAGTNPSAAQQVIQLG